MNKLMIAVAATIALPAAAFAQATLAPTAAAPGGHDTKAMHCKDMHANMSGSHTGHQVSGAGGQADQSMMDHRKMDHSKMTCSGDMAKAGAAQAPSDAHANHNQ